MKKAMEIINRDFEEYVNKVTNEDSSFVYESERNYFWYHMGMIAGLYLSEQISPDEYMECMKRLKAESDKLYKEVVNR